MVKGLPQLPSTSRCRKCRTYKQEMGVFSAMIPFGITTKLIRLTLNNTWSCVTAVSKTHIGFRQGDNRCFTNSELPM